MSEYKIPLKESNSEDLNKYRKAINNLAGKNEDLIFDHAGVEKSSIIMSTIFKYAKSSLRIYAGNLNGGISEKKEYLSSLNNFIEREGEVKVLIQNIDSTNPSEAYQLLDMYSGFNENVKILLTNTELINPKKHQSFHFTVGDNNMFRVETDTKNFAGYASFNSPEIAKNLCEIFDSIFEKEISYLEI